MGFNTNALDCEWILIKLGLGSVGTVPNDRYEAYEEYFDHHFEYKLKGTQVRAISDCFQTKKVRAISDCQGLICALNTLP